MTANIHSLSRALAQRDSSRHTIIPEGSIRGATLIANDDIPCRLCLSRLDAFRAYVNECDGLRKACVRHVFPRLRRKNNVRVANECIHACHLSFLAGVAKPLFLIIRQFYRRLTSLRLQRTKKVIMPGSMHDRRKTRLCLIFRAPIYFTLKIWEFTLHELNASLWLY